jgi:hypothetical protein
MLAMMRLAGPEAGTMEGLSGPKVQVQVQVKEKRRDCAPLGKWSRRPCLQQHRGSPLG